MPSSSSATIYTVGGSKNIGYYASLRLLDAGANVTFLLRNTTEFGKDSAIQKYVSSGKARLVKGDALKEDDCRKGWAEASKDGPVDYLIFTVGGTPSFSMIRGGFQVTPFDLCTKAYLNAVSTIPANSTPNLICLSSKGIGKKSKASIPFALKPVYVMIRQPLADKRGMERITFHLGGMNWDSHDLGEPAADLMGGSNWAKHPGLPVAGSYKNKVVVVRAAMLNDGECLSDSKTNAYRASTDELGGSDISRKDTGHFVAQLCLGDWEKWGGNVVNVGY